MCGNISWSMFSQCCKLILVALILAFADVYVLQLSEDLSHGIANLETSTVLDFPLSPYIKLLFPLFQRQ